LRISPLPLSFKFLLADTDAALLLNKVDASVSVPMASLFLVFSVMLDNIFYVSESFLVDILLGLVALS
jgi:hypothetical protein